MELIDKQATLDNIIKNLGIRDENFLLPAEEALYKVVKNEPSVQPTQRTGKWMKNEELSIFFDIYKCSICGGGGALHFKYCPNCGAKMEEDDADAKS